MEAERAHVEEKQTLTFLRSLFGADKTYSPSFQFQLKDYVLRKLFADFPTVVGEKPPQALRAQVCFYWTYPTGILQVFVSSLKYHLSPHTPLGGQGFYLCLPSIGSPGLDKVSAMW